MMNSSNEQILLELEKTPGAVENLLLQVFVPVTENIKRAEDILKAYILRSSSVSALIEQMQKSQHANARQLAAVLLRKSMPRHWKTFNSKDQAIIKATLLEIVKREPERVVRQSLAVLISQLAKVLYNDNKENWPELLVLISVLTQDPDPNHRELSFVLLQHLAESSGNSLQNHYGELQNLFDHALDDPNPKVQAGALHSYGALLTHLRMEKEGKLYSELIPKTLSVAKACVARGDEESVVSVSENLCEWCLSPQPLTKPYIAEIVDYLLYVMGHEDLELSTRDTASLALSTLAETKGKLLAKSGKVPTCLEVFARLIASYEGSATNSLFRYEALDDNEESEGDDVADGPSEQSIAQTALDEMALNLPTKSIFEPVMSICGRCFPSPNPKERKAGVAMMGVIAEGCQEPIKARLNQILPEVLRAAQDIDANVRECACFCLGQFSEHCQPDILDYHAEILPVIFQLLQDATDNVKGVSCYVLEMFCENLEPRQVLPILEPLMNRLILMLETPKKSVQEMTVAAIAATAIAAEKDFKPYVVMVYRYIGQLLTITAEPMLGLRGRALECMGHIAIAVEADAFAPYVEASMACAIQGLGIDSVDLHEYSYTFFANLSKVFGDRMAPYVPDLVNHLLGAVAESDGEEVNFASADSMGTDGGDFSLLAQCNSSAGDDDDEFSDDIPFFNVRTAMTDEKKAALLALGALAEYASASYMPFLEQSLIQFALLCDYWHGDIRGEVCNCLKCLVKVSVTCNNLQKWEKGKVTPLPEPLQQLCDPIIALLLQIMMNDPEAPVVTAACEAFSGILDLVGPALIHCTDLRCSKLIQTTVMLLDEKAPCQCKFERYSDEEYDDSPEEGEGQVLVEAVGEILCAYARVLGELFIPDLDMLWPKLAKYSQGHPPREKAMAMGTFAEIIEEIGPTAHRYFDQLLPMLKRCMSDEDARVRRNTAFCVGIMAEIGGAAYRDHFPALLQTLAATFQNSTNGVVKGGQQETYVLDNAASAVARIIMADEGRSAWIQQALPLLLSAIPLKVDMNENKAVYTCVSGLLVMGHPVALQHASAILTALAKALGQEKVDIEVKKEIATQLQNMSKTEHSSSISAAMQTVPEDLQRTLLQTIQHTVLISA